MVLFVVVPGAVGINAACFYMLDSDEDRFGRRAVFPCLDLFSLCEFLVGGMKTVVLVLSTCQLIVEKIKEM